MPSNKTKKKKPSKTTRKSRTKSRKQSPALTQSFRFTIEAIGPRRDKQLLAKIIKTARDEALREFAGAKPKQASVEPPGGLFGFGAEVVYVLHLVWPYVHAAGNVVAKGIATEAGKELFKIFADKLRKKDIRPSEPEVSTPEIKPDVKTESEKKADTTPPNP